LAVHVNLAESAPFPTRVGSAEQSARLRTFLRNAGYTRPAILERTGVADFDQLPELRDDGQPRPIRDALDLLVRLFLEGDPVAESTLAGHFPADVVGLLQELGLLRTFDGREGTWGATVALYPSGETYIVSDPLRLFAGKRLHERAPDLVYPAVSSNSCEFLAALPTTPCDTLLDVGAGTGVAALAAAASYARHAVAVDLTARATRAAEFNAALNGIDNVTVLRGDLYDPVGGATFDRIVAHPPYMPATGLETTFRDGGDDGETITRRIVAGLPAHLRPGGRFCCRCLGTDRKGAPFEQRVRDMLGTAGPDFDVLVVARSAMPPWAFYAHLLAKGVVSASAVELQLRTFDSLAAEQILVGLVFIDRHLEPRAPLTLRRELKTGTASLAESASWLLAWHRAAVDPRMVQPLLAGRPIVSPHAEISLKHQLRDGELYTQTCKVATRVPFPFTLESSPGVMFLLVRSNGTNTIAQLYDQMRELGVVPPNGPMDEFLDLVRSLVGGGVLELQDFPLPADAGGNLTAGSVARPE
jgi:SAM-dependent methyltransferase